MYIWGLFGLGHLGGGGHCDIDQVADCVEILD
jgi:hypothetical protein